MDHQDAVQTQALEKYLLGQLGDPERDAFEEHYFECTVCADEISTAVVFADNAAAETRGAARSHAPETRQASWRDWFRFEWRQPAFALPAFALIALALFSFADHQRLNREWSDATAPQVFERVPLDVARGKAPAVTRTGRYFAISFFIDNDTLPSYAIDITGNGATPVTLQTRHKLNQSYDLLLPTARYSSGRYQVIVRGGPGTNGNTVEKFDLNIE